MTLQVHHATSKLTSAPQSPEEFADLLDFMEQLERRRHGLDDTYDHVRMPSVCVAFSFLLQLTRASRFADGHVALPFLLLMSASWLCLLSKHACRSLHVRVYIVRIYMYIYLSHSLSLLTYILTMFWSSACVRGTLWLSAWHV